MRTLKKAMCLVLAMVMVFGLMVTANASSFTDDAEINPTFAEAADVLNGIKVFEGYNDGSFDPKGLITRAEVATVLYRIVTGDVKKDQVDIYSDWNKFDDVTSDKWYAGYVNFVANGKLVMGRGNGIYDPSGNVTGYEVLAMMLRAIGYGKNGEFEGTGWEIETATLAKSLGITKNINTSTLGSPATREAVAEMIFQAIRVPTVTYTALVGYNKYNNALGYVDAEKTPLNYSLAQDVFHLYKTKITTIDDWGRPGCQWAIAPNAARAQELDGLWLTAADDDDVVVETVYGFATSYTDITDECDIYEDAGLTKDADIYVAFIDGVYTNPTDPDVTADKGGKINKLDVDKNVGARGRQTEVYVGDFDEDGADEVWLVEINTYLAKATKVEAGSTDKNGHEKKTKVTFDVYVTRGNENEAHIILKDDINSDDFAVGDWALVEGLLTVDEEGVQTGISIEKATPVKPSASGKVNDYDEDPDTTTVGEEKYYDADKFVYIDEEQNNSGTKYFSKDAALDETRAVIEDEWGNIIGLVIGNTNLMVIEKIQWFHGNDFDEGHARADLRLADGTKVSGVTVYGIGDGKYASNVGDSFGDPTEGTVSDDYRNNGGNDDNNDGDYSDTDDTLPYYKHIWSYSVDANGLYNISLHDDADVAAGTNGFYDLTDGEIAKGGHMIYGGSDDHINAIVADDDTVFLVLNKDGYTYTVYEGISNLPNDMSGVRMCVKVDAKDYADLVVITENDSAAQSLVAYVRAPIAKAATKANVYPLGSTTSQRIDVDLSGTSNGIEKTGLYVFKYNSGKYELDTDAEESGASSAGYVLLSLDGSAGYAKYANTTLTPNNKIDNVMFDRGAVKEDLRTSSLQVEQYSGATANEDGYTVSGTGTKLNDYVLDADTAYIKVTKTVNSATIDNTSTEKITSGSKSQLKEGKVVIVAYTEREVGSNTIRTAKAVYIYETEYVAPAGQGGSIKGITVKQLKYGDSTGYKFQLLFELDTSSDLTAASTLGNFSGWITIKDENKKVLVNKYDIVDGTGSVSDIEAGLTFINSTNADGGLQLEIGGLGGLGTGKVVYVSLELKNATDLTGETFTMTDYEVAIS